MNKINTWSGYANKSTCLHAVIHPFFWFTLYTVLFIQDAVIVEEYCIHRDWSSKGPWKAHVCSVLCCCRAVTERPWTHGHMGYLLGEGNTSIQWWDQRLHTGRDSAPWGTEERRWRTALWSKGWETHLWTGEMSVHEDEEEEEEDMAKLRWTAWLNKTWLVWASCDCCPQLIDTWGLQITMLSYSSKLLLLPESPVYLYNNDSLAGRHRPWG